MYIYIYIHIHVFTHILLIKQINAWASPGRAPPDGLRPPAFARAQEKHMCVFVCV